MAIFVYGPSSTEIPLDDRVLAHLKIVMLAKLRRNESFAFSWEEGEEGNGARSTVWIHPAIPLQFKHDEGPAPILNKAWIDQLMQSANTTAGLRVVPEPIAEPAMLHGT